jgi:CheY-like chemotaxis protein
VRLKQVLLNLLSNAIKYNHEGGSVRLACHADGDALRIEIRDSGPGLGLAEQERLFQAFERLDADKSGVEGAGIGLALSKWLVELMHGEIGVESQPGLGSTFWVRLARCELQPVTALAAPAEGTAPPAVPAAHGRTVLYIEDNPVNQALMEGMLGHRAGLRLLMAEQPEAGLALAKQARPDLVLLDIQLPGIDGFEVLRRLRANARTRKIPVVAVSANAMPADLAQARAAGFAEYLTKPLDLPLLLATVDRMLGTPALA